MEGGNGGGGADEGGDGGGWGEGGEVGEGGAAYVAGGAGEEDFGHGMGTSVKDCGWIWQRLGLWSVICCVGVIVSGGQGERFYISR